MATQEGMPTQEECVESAKALLIETHEHFQSLAEANKEAQEAAVAGLVTATGTAIFSVAFFYGKVRCDLTFNDGTKLTFNGTEYGLGLGGGVAFGGGPFSVTPGELLRLGSCSFTVQAQAAVAGGVLITFLSGLKVLGTFVGAGLAVSNIPFTAGSGEWTAGS